MLVIMDIHIVTRTSVHELLRKEIETTLVPIPSVQIEDSAWREPRKPASIVCDFQENYYLLTFESEEHNSEEAAKKAVEMYVSHGWKAPGARR